MTETLLLAVSTERLAAALHEAEHSRVSEPCYSTGPDDRRACQVRAQRIADALLASGAVVPAASLVDDEALVERITRERLGSDLKVWPGDHDTTRHGLRALAAAWADR